MTKNYRVLIKHTEYRNCYVLAESEEQAREKVLDGYEYDSEFVDYGDAEVQTVEVWE